MSDSPIATALRGAPGPNTRHVFIAVHGIGDQQRNSTVLAVASRMALSEHIPLDGGIRPLAPQSLGFFHRNYSHYGVSADAPASLFLEEKKLKGLFARSGFTEVFWADIPKEVNENKDTLEETKAWARTVAARAERLFNEARTKASLMREPEPDFSLASEVLEEIVDTVNVLENLTYLAEKAGIFSFDLQELLNDYVGDVQLVTEFRDIRLNVLGAFYASVERIYEAETQKYQQAHPTGPQLDLRLHIVAHSEGTVVTFLALLYALAGFRVRGYDKERADGDPKSPTWRKAKTGELNWLDCVSSLMTIGSPIDKHILLWDHLWSPFEEIAEERKRHPEFPSPWRICNREIKWRNYYDYGDPVGFKLDSARSWLTAVDCTAFEFDEFRDDIGFSRYVFPGKAHNDYWDDAAVFDHFLTDAVLQLPPAAESSVFGAARRSAKRLIGMLIPRFQREKGAAADAAPCPTSAPRPGSKKGAIVLSYLIPYLLSFGILLVGCFILYKTTSDTVKPSGDLLYRYVRFTLAGTQPPKGASGAELALNVLGLAVLVAGVTLYVRFFRLIRRWWASVAAFCAFAVGFVGYLLLVSPRSRYDIAAPIVALVHGPQPQFPQLAPTSVMQNLGNYIWNYAWSCVEMLKTATFDTGKLVPIRTALHDSFAAAKPLTEDLVTLAGVFLVAFIGCWSGQSSGLKGEARRARYIVRGMRPMLISGVALIAMLMATDVFQPKKERSQLELGAQTERSIESALKDKSDTALDYRVPLPKAVSDKLTVQTRNAIAVLNALDSGTISPKKLEEKFNVPTDTLTPQSTLSQTSIPWSVPQVPRGVTSRKPEAVIQEAVAVNDLLNQHPRLWPLFLALLAFFYMWWLAALLFELTFVWHYYIRRNKTNEALLRWKQAVWSTSNQKPAEAIASQ